jgi:pimeloyl-ACP methyl ester carboxylesterase
MNDPLYLEHDQCRLAYSVDGTGSPVLLIQGVGVAGSGWRPQLTALRAHHRCLWYDNRGLGSSAPGTGRLTVQQLAADARALLDSQGWARAHLVGHSLGGLIALRLALDYPERVHSLALLCTFARGRAAGASLRMAWIGLRTRIGSRRSRRAAFFEILAAPGSLTTADEERLSTDLAPLFGHDLADHPAVEAAQLSAMRGYDATSELGRLRGIPTLVVSAFHDPIAPPELGRVIADGIPNARYVVLPDASHGAPILATAAVNALLLEHLAAVDKATVAS